MNYFSPDTRKTRLIIIIKERSDDLLLVLRNVIIALLQLCAEFQLMVKIK